PTAKESRHGALRRKEWRRLRSSLLCLEMEEAAQERRALELDLREALASDLFQLYLQPPVDLRTGSGGPRSRHALRPFVPPRSNASWATQLTRKYAACSTRASATRRLSAAPLPQKSRGAMRSTNSCSGSKLPRPFP